MRIQNPLKFGAPDNGWITLEVDGHVADVSDVPCDSIYGLCKAILRLSQGSSHEEVEWSLEPEYERWVFCEAGDSFSWTIYRNKKELVRSWTANRVVIARMISEPLMELYNQSFTDDCQSSDWSSEFPYSLLLRARSKMAEQDAAPQIRPRWWVGGLTGGGSVVELVKVR